MWFLKYPLEILLFVGLTYALFKLFCRLANSSTFSRTLKSAKGTAETDADLIAAREGAARVAIARADEIDGEIAAKKSASERLRG